MKPILLFLSFIIFTFGSVSQQLRIEPMIQDLGELRQMDSREVAFTLYNTGSDTLRLGRPRAGCGCTQVKLDNSILAAGDSARLSVRFATGPHMLGEITKSLQIGQLAGSDEVNMQTMRIKAIVVGDIKAEPDRISFRSVIGDTVRIRLFLHSNTTGPVHIDQISPVLTAFVDTSSGSAYRADRVTQESFDAISWSLSTKTIQSGASEYLDLTLVPTKRGQINGFIRITMPGSELRVSVIGVVLYN